MVFDPKSEHLGYLARPPEGRGETPSSTRPQTLRTSSLTPRDFERLCYRIARLDSEVVQCRFYGNPGQAQQGIDLYARRTDGTYGVIQCKRRTGEFTPPELTAAVDSFLGGDWAAAARTFVLAVSANCDDTRLADRIEDERRRLAERDIVLAIWDELEISSILKEQPTLVDDFFGRDAVRVFLGDNVANRLGERLDAADFFEYRQSLGRLYQEVFHRLERGIHGDDHNVGLEDRFVLPDVLISGGAVGVVSELVERSGDQESTAAQLPTARSRRQPAVVDVLRNPRLGAPARSTPVRHEDRVAVIDWLHTGRHHLVLGSPGSGKSALLRMVVLDVLAPEPLFVERHDRFLDVIPVWLPFAFWTNAAQRQGKDVSVLDAVRAWLETYDHGHLWPLVERAMRDQRLLVVVDGLDEWASPDLARVCVDRLEVFASTKSVQVLASSRPVSATDIPIDTSRWRIATLAPLDQTQRLDFVRRWLAPLVSADEVESEASAWASEIETSAHLRELSDLPLFLVLLLRSREQQAEFPEDLHAVLSDAVSRLVGDHRRRKIDTAIAADRFPSPGDIRRVSAATAELMHLSSRTTLSDDDLREVFHRTLSESVGYPDGVAHSLAVALVNSLSPGVGLLVRPALNETQFFHRSVLEFLTAERLQERPPADQRDLFREHVHENRWGQVLRFLVRALTRPDEIAAIFGELEGTAGAHRCEATTLLAADVATGAGQVDALTRRRLLARVTSEVEEGERLGHRGLLVDRLAGGLARHEINDELSQRFAGWLRGVDDSTWSSLLRAVSNWPPDDDLLRFAWHGILADDDRVQRAAARVLATSFPGDAGVAERLAALASQTWLHDRRAAATEALSLGWSNHPAVDDLISRGKEHYDFAVRHSALAADLRRGNATSANRQLLMGLLDHAPRLSSWDEGVMDLILEHYADDDVVYEHYVEAAHPDQGNFRYNDIPATFLILKGFTGRPRAREYLLELLSPSPGTPFAESPTLLTDRLPWAEIAATYSEDSEVVAAVENLARRHATSSIGERDLYFCSLVARTDWVRDRLIDRVRRRDAWGVGWAIRALVEGWADDAGAKAAIASLVDPEQGPVPDRAIWRLPDIITEPDAALDRLAAIAAVHNDQGTVIDTVSRLIELGVARDDQRVQAIVDRALAHDMSSPWTSAEAALYVGFADDARVRDLALKRIHARDAPLAAVAYGFRDDPAVRQLVTDTIRPLNPALRGRLVGALAETSSNDARATSLLGRHDTETDPVVRILATTAYVRRLAATDAVTEGLVDEFTEQARALGHDHHERRAAAFCALAELGRLDRLVGLTDRVTPDQPVQIQDSALGDRSVFFRVVCRHWTDVKTAFGENFQSRFGYRDSSDSEFWQNVLAVGHDYPTTRDDLGRILAQRPELVRSAAGVSYLSRTEPRSGRLRQACIDLLEGVSTQSYAEIQPSFVALDVLADQFEGDGVVDAWLDEAIRKVGESRSVRDGRPWFSLPALGVVAAIARHTRNKEVAAELAAFTARPQQGRWHYFHEWAELTAGVVRDAQEFVDFAVALAEIVVRNDMFAEYLYRPLLGRLRRDAQLRAEVRSSIPSLREPAVGLLTRLLTITGSIDMDVLLHLHSRLESVKAESATGTVDPLTARVRHEALLMLDVLDTVV